MVWVVIAVSSLSTSVRVIQTPAGYERSTEIVVRDPDLRAFAPQPGEIAQGWRPIDPDATPADTLEAFHPALEAAGYQLVLVTECTDDVLSLVYWHPDTGTANLGHGDTATRRKAFSFSSVTHGRTTLRLQDGRRSTCLIVPDRPASRGVALLMACQIPPWGGLFKSPLHTCVTTPVIYTDARRVQAPS